MKLTKNQKMLLGVGAVAVVGYMLWKKQQTSFTGAVGRRQKNAVGSDVQILAGRNGALATIKSKTQQPTNRIAGDTCKGYVPNNKCSENWCSTSLEGARGTCACYGPYYKDLSEADQWYWYRNVYACQKAV